MNRRDIVAGLALAFAVLHMGCSESPTSESEFQPAGLDVDLLDSLFRNFSPQYNYTDGETSMLAHAAQVSLPGYEPWRGSLGYVDSLESSDLSANSVFRVGSATKTFTATMILQLWEEGLIDLDSSFNHYLALDEATYPRIGQFSGVTVRHLLSHRSGVPYISSTTFFDVHEYTDSIAQTERMRFLFTEGEPEFAPGTQYAYRNSNYNILGLVIERVCGEPYHTVLQDRISSQLGLVNTHMLDYDISPDDERIVHGYFQTFDGVHYHGSQAWAAGGLVSNVQDLSTFMRALVDGALFQQQSTFDLMVSPEEGSRYGFGMFLTYSQQGLSYGHSGSVFGYNTKLEYFPDIDVIVSANMSFNGDDFVVVNWLSDFCFPVLVEARRALR